ncbi:LLM class flavin-dependent oxidoreductase [Nocardioides sp. Kera G14]|uniref:LLM class flavin-dependent oxidoreductase n=1 Tax=Nocardioides sp. Kera G14 TaxID=2884264 RepID=UPI001D0F913C|nr:LLM class flavin-dependent oxidoreductase [Nocardioides sp. Kera G14]UDY23557.1 LLM class flavin-dependent oxidoreductase [Nocardioides sp. Kera G14]
MTRPLKKLGFLTLGLFDPADPGAGHEELLEVIELGEKLGFDSAWLRHRHLQYGVSSPVAIMAAATQRTRRIELGTAVTPLGAENPFRLAEDLATVDILSATPESGGRGRINPGFSVGPPMNYERYKAAIHPDTADLEQLGFPRLQRFLDYVSGQPVSDFEGTVGIETFDRRIQPQSPGLAQRTWYGAGSLNSAEWAGRHGLNLLSSSVVRAEHDFTAGRADGAEFARIQRHQIDLFREHHPAGEDARVSQGLVVIPTDSATPDQVERYTAYRESRLARTREPQGPGLLFAPDLVGTSAQIAEQLHEHAGFQAVDEVAFALPFTFRHEDYVQILTDMAGALGPALGWSPTTAA